MGVLLCLWKLVLLCKKNIFFIAIVFLFLSPLIVAQDITGNIEGLISDSIGKPLLGVNISLISTALLGNRGAATNEKGYFQILILPVGTYTMKLSAVGFRQMNVEDVEVQLGKTTNVGKIVLKSQAVSLPEISVSGKKPLIDPVSTSYGGNISSADFEQLPVDRSYKDIVTLLPQANLSYYGDGANIGGATGLGNKYFVDGVDVTDPLFGGKAMDLPYNFIQEIEVKAGGYGVDTRSSLGGLINVITYSGSNEFHGSAFGFYTNNQLSSNYKLSSLGQGEFSNYDAGFGLGGPLIPDKLWFYAAYNPTFYERDVEIPGFGIYVDKTLTHKFAFKLNWRALNNLNVVFTATGDPTQRDHVKSGLTTVSLLNPDSYLVDTNEGSVNYSVNGTYNINDNILLKGLIARVDRYEHTLPTTVRGRNEILYVDYVDQISYGGTGNKNWDAFRRSTFGKISATILLNKHTLTTGIDYKYSSFDITHEGQSVLRYKNDVGEETYEAYLQNYYGDVRSRIPSVFAQDNWRILNRMTVTVGIRWEDQSVIDANGGVIQTVSVPLQPLIGIVFLPDENNTQRIFASYRRSSHEYAQLATNFNLGYEQTIRYHHDPRLDNTGGEIISYFEHPIKPEQKEIQGQYSDEFSLGYERVLGWNIKAAIQGVYRSLGEAIEDIYLQDENRTVVGNPGQGFLSDWPKARRDYEGLIITIERSGDEHFNFLASYVLSRNYGNYEGLYDAYNHRGPNANVMFNKLETSWINTTGLVPNDRTHVFKIAGYYNFSFGLSTGISFIAESGTPLSEYAGGTTLAIKFLLPRGSVGRTPTIWDLNARLIYNLNFISKWHSKLILDVFHIASQQKAVEIFQRKFWDPGETSPTNLEGQVTRYQPSISARLGMEVSF